MPETSPYDRYLAAEAESRKDAIAAIKAKCVEWEATGLTEIKVTYDGSGDDGSIRQFAAWVKQISTKVEDWNYGTPA